MKKYGAKKATEFTKKQIGVIYASAKSGELKVERFIISKLYDMAEYYGYDNNGSAAEEEAKILAILDKVFEKNYTEAQELIDTYTERVFANMGRKAQQSANREIL